MGSLVRELWNHGSASASKLEAELRGVHRELVALRNDYRELGLKTSCLTLERDRALGALARTEAYIDIIDADRQIQRNLHSPARADRCTQRRQCARCGTVGNIRSTDARVSVEHGIVPPGEARRAKRVMVDVLRRCVTPNVCLVKTELSWARSEYSALEDAYRMLETCAETAAQERDAALQELERARLVAEALAPASHRNQLAQDEPADTPLSTLASGLACLQEKLYKTQLERNDVAIKLAENNERVSELREREAQLCAQLHVLEQRLARSETETATVRLKVQELTAALDQARGEQARAVSRYRENVGTLQQRLAGIGGELDVTRQQAESLQAVLAETRSRHQITLRERQDLEQQLGTLEALVARLQLENNGIRARLSDVEQARVLADREHELLTGELQKSQAAHAESRRRYRSHIEGLRRRVAALLPELDAANREIRTLVVSLPQASDRQVTGDGHSAAPSMQPEQRAGRVEDSGEAGPCKVNFRSAGVAPGPGMLRKESNWTKVVAACVLLLGTLGSLTKIWEIDADGSRRTAVTREVGVLMPPGGDGAQRSLPLAETTDPAALDSTHSTNASHAHAEQMAANQASHTSATPLQKQARDSIRESVPGNITTARRGDSATLPLARAYLMKPNDATDTWYESCAKGKGDATECALLEKNLFKESVVRLPSGVQYTPIRNGTGTSPGPHDRVLVNFRGMLLDGTEFDNSDRRGGASSFRVDEAIPGLQDVLPYMEVGARWEVYVPADRAFRKPAPFGGQVVVFDIELIEVGNAVPIVDTVTGVTWSTTGLAKSALARPDAESVHADQLQASSDPAGMPLQEESAATRAIDNAREARERILSHPAVLLEMVGAQAASKDGRFIGYLVTATVNSDFLGQLDLLPGDLIVAVNGVPIDTPDQGLDALTALSGTGLLSFTVIRDGYPRVLSQFDP